MSLLLTTAARKAIEQFGGLINLVRACSIRWVSPYPWCGAANDDVELPQPPQACGP